MPSAPSAGEPNAPQFQLKETDDQVPAEADDGFVCHDWDDLRNIISQLLRSPRSYVK
jgi:hypothetical protein